MMMIPGPLQKYLPNPPDVGKRQQADIQVVTWAPLLSPYCIRYSQANNFVNVSNMCRIKTGIQLGLAYGIGIMLVKSVISSTKNKLNGSSS